MRYIELSTEINGQRIKQEFNKPTIIIGRAANSDFCLPDPRISSMHGQIIRRAGVDYYQDNKSTNGSMLESQGERYIVDGVKFKEHALSDGDCLLLGDVQKPIAVSVRMWEVESEEAPQIREKTPGSLDRTILASRAISDFSMLSPQILDDKSLVRTLFRFQKDISEEENLLKIYDKTRLFLFNHLPNLEYAAIHAEDFAERNKWRQVYFTSRISDINQKLNDTQGVLSSAWNNRESILFDAEQLEALRSIGSGGKRLQSMALAPLIHKDRIIGFIEAGNTSNQAPLTSSDLDLISIVAYILSAKTVILKLSEAVQKAQEGILADDRHLRLLLGRKGAVFKMVGQSKQMQAIRRQIEKVAASDITVLILGETGTGKEVAAREIHRQSKRRDRFFAAINCTAVPEALLESELFGHVKGSFTGAVENKKGLFEVADNGTLFLDEIGEAPQSLQVKLLRALQEGEIMPVGATRPIKVDARLICATNRDLYAEVEAGRFREDLYYRINSFPLYLQPLREHPEDILPLAEKFLAEFEVQMNRKTAGFSEECRRKLTGCSFPGNIRQLKNEVQRALLMAEDNHPIEIQHFSPQIFCSDKRAGEIRELHIGNRNIKDIMDEYEIAVIRKALEENGWNRSKTAGILGISRQAFMAKLARYGISQEK